MTYHFRTADGRTCCRTDRMEGLCVRCKAELEAGRITTELPSLVDRVRSARGLPLLEVHAGEARMEAQSMSHQ